MRCLALIIADQRGRLAMIAHESALGRAAESYDAVDYWFAVVGEKKPDAETRIFAVPPAAPGLNRPESVTLAPGLSAEMIDVDISTVAYGGTAAAFSRALAAMPGMLDDRMPSLPAAWVAHIHGVAMGLAPPIAVPVVDDPPVARAASFAPPPARAATPPSPASPARTAMPHWSGLWSYWPAIDR